MKDFTTILPLELYQDQRMFSEKYSYSKNPVFYHVLFWLAYFAINTVRWGSYYNDYLYSIKSNAVEFPLHMAIVYFNLYVLMPRFIPKRVGLYVLSLFSGICVTILLKGVLTYQFVTTDLFKESPIEEPLFGINYLMASFIGELYVVGVVTAIKITIDWVKYKDKTQELSKTNLETELAYLKSQIQPHFFFNTLNNLYSLTLDKSDRAPETVLKLSELMSYVIYDAREKTVSLSNEINHINNYIDLERLRFGDRLKLDFDLSGDISGVELPPIIFLPFIENCFKHGTRTRANEIPISIKVEIIDKWLYFSCKNKLSEEPAVASKYLENENHGVGLKNTERRLKLRYGDDFDLKVSQENGDYLVKLKIPVK